MEPLDIRPFPCIQNSNAIDEDVRPVVPLLFCIDVFKRSGLCEPSLMKWTDYHIYILQIPSSSLHLPSSQVSRGDPLTRASPTARLHRCCLARLFSAPCELLAVSQVCDKDHDRALRR